jgi:hypothetical protein
MSNAHQPGSEPISIPEQIPNPAVQPKVPKPEPVPQPRKPVKVPQHEGGQNWTHDRVERTTSDCNTFDNAEPG